MTPQEKAKELFDKYDDILPQFESSYDDVKQCALIAVDLHLNELSKMKLIFSDREIHYNYWQQVKTEIQKI